MLVIGNTYNNVICESFLESRTNRIRVRSIGNKNIPEGVLIECLKSIRERYLIGTKFYAEEIKVCKKTDGEYILEQKVK